MTATQLIFTDAVCRRAEEIVSKSTELRTVMSSSADLAFIRDRSSSSTEAFALACERYAHRDCFRSAQSSITYGELWARVTAVAARWRHDNLAGPGMRVGIYGAPSTDWVVADLACLVAGAISVPLSTTSTDAELRALTEHAGLRMVVSDAAVIETLERSLAAVETCRDVVSMEDLGRSAPPARIVAHAWTSDEPVTVMYTSGSTSRAKGVLLTERRWLSQLQTALSWPPFPHVQIGYLPLSSIAGRRFIFEAMMHGGITHFASDALPFSDVPVVRPTLIGMAPRVSTVLYQQFKSQLLARLGRIPEQLFDDPASIALLDEMRSTALGDRLCMIRLGSGDSAPDVLEFLDRCFRVHVANSYGQTETSSIMINGRVLPYVEYRLVDVPELGYFTTDRPPRGELVVRSIDVSPGYLNDPDATAALFEADGFLRTGDIVEEREPGLLAWIDRRQAVIKLAQGLFVAPARLEVLYVAGSPFIEQIYLYANPRLAFLLAVIVPNLQAFEPHDRGNEEALRRILRGELDRIARAEKLRSHDVPRDFVIEREPFSQGNQLLLETGKQSPRRLREHYGARLDELGKAVEARQLGAEIDAGGDTASAIRSMFGAVLGLPVGELTMEASFVGFGGDSVSALRLCSLVEQAFTVSVPVGIVLDPSATIASTVDRILKLMAGGRDTPTFEDVHGAAATVVQASDLDPLVPGNERGVANPASGAPSSVFLTGATGFLGRLLALELERRLPTGGRLTCLVRGADERAARERMRVAMATAAPELGSWFDAATASGRLAIVAGDLQAPQFGLPARAYDELVAGIDAIVHNGALVNHAMSYRDLFEPNVLGALEVTRIAAARPSIDVNFVSSIGVAALSRSEPVAERDRASVLWPTRSIGSGPDDHAVGYITSKWAGEVLLERLHERHGVHVNVFRCSNIAPHHTYLSHLNWADMTNRLLLGIVATGLAPDSFYEPGTVVPRHEILPLDTVADRIAAVSATGGNGFRAFHISSANTLPVSLDALVDWTASAGIAVKRLPHAEWFPAFRASLERLAPADRARSPLAVLSRWGVPHARDRFAPIETSGELARLDEQRVHTWVRRLAAELGSNT